MDDRRAAELLGGKGAVRRPILAPPTLRQGYVRGVNGDGTVILSLGGDDTEIPGVSCLVSYNALPGDAVWVMVNGTDLLVIGTSTGAGGSPVAHRNRIHNGAFRVSQRGNNASMSTNSGTGRSGPDRWMAFRGGYAAGATWSRVTSTPPSGFRAYGRCQRTAGNTATADLVLAQTLEAEDTIPLRGSPLAVSFWARAGANLSSAGSSLALSAYSGTGDGESVADGLTGGATLLFNTFTLSTSWQKFYALIPPLAATVTQLAITFAYSPSGTAGASDYFDVTGVQLERGTPTPFEHLPYAQELDVCDRFFQRITSGAAAAEPIGNGYASTTTLAVATATLRRRMRAAPSFSVSAAGDFQVALPGGGTSAVTNLTSASAARATLLHRLTVTTTGLTVGQGLLLTTDATGAATMDFAAEL